MKIHLCTAVLMAATISAASSASAASAQEFADKDSLAAMLAFSPAPRPTSPSWGQLRGTTLVFDEGRWRKLQQPKTPGFRAFSISASALVIGFNEFLEPMDTMTPEMLLADMEKNQRVNFLRFESAPGDSPLNGVKVPQGGSCNRLQVQAEGGQPAWYMHCTYVRGGQATYLHVTAPLDVSAADVAAINEVFETVRPRSWRAPAAFHTQPFPDLNGVPVSLRLRLPERFAQPKNEFGRIRMYCDRDDTMQFSELGPADLSTCIQVRVSPGESYSPASGRFTTEDMVEKMRSQLQGMSISSDRRQVRGRPAFEVTAQEADQVAHFLLIVDGERVVEVSYTEPTGVGADGYDAIWRELLDGLEE